MSVRGLDSQAGTPDPLNASLGRGVHELVREWAEARPAACAIREPDSGRELTYAQLWQRTGELAARLVSAGIGRGDVVVVDVDRSAAMVVAMLGVARAGAAFLPLDRLAPASRIATIIHQSRASAIVASTLGRAASTSSATTPVFDVNLDAPLSDTNVDSLDRTGGDDPFYVNYTSGSTGQPKGVVVPHRAVIRLVVGQDYCRFLPGQRVANVSNPAFDATTFEIWGALTSGATVVPFPSLTDIILDDWISLVRKESIDIMCLTTSLFHTVARERPDGLRSVDTLLVGGEQLDLKTTLRVLSAGPPRRVVNGYGPTETTTFATYFECTVDSLADRDRIPIGTPLRHTTAYVLDDDWRPVTPEEPGELFIGGPGVALGYLHEPELTAERFVAPPACGERVYRTGDVVRAAADGTLDMLGRKDRQVKLRGFRVELEEIEHATIATGLAGAAFVDKLGEGVGASLVGFVLPSPQAPPGRDELTTALSQRLAERLPEYMIPSRWVVLDEVPLGPTGKADRARILAIHGHADTTPSPARTDTERTLAAIWAEILDVPTVGVDDDFFTLGGHSLFATQILSRVRNEFGVDLSMRKFFESPTVAGMAAQLATAQKAEPSIASRITRWNSTGQS